MKINEGMNGKPIFEAGKKYTVFKISETTAMTIKSEITITRLDAEGPVYQLRGKRKEFVLRLKYQSDESGPVKMFTGAVFAGWDQPITCDTDGGTYYRGNACFNFVGSVAEIKKWIENNQLNPLFEVWKTLAVKNTGHADDEELVFPELYRGGHAVLDRILAVK